MGVNGSRMDRDRIFYDGDDRRNSGERQYDAEQEKVMFCGFEKYVFTRLYPFTELSAPFI